MCAGSLSSSGWAMSTPTDVIVARLRRLLPRFLVGGTGIAKLLLASPDPSQWQDTGLHGVVVLLKDTLLQSCVIQVPFPRPFAIEHTTSMAAVCTLRPGRAASACDCDVVIVKGCTAWVFAVVRPARPAAPVRVRDLQRHGVRVVGRVPAAAHVRDGLLHRGPTLFRRAGRPEVPTRRRKRDTPGDQPVRLRA